MLKVVLMVVDSGDTAIEQFGTYTLMGSHRGRVDFFGQVTSNICMSPFDRSRAATPDCRSDFETSSGLFRGDFPHFSGKSP